MRYRRRYGCRFLSATQRLMRRRKALSNDLGRSVHRYMERSVIWPNDGVTNHGATSAAFIHKDVTAICGHGDWAFALRPAIVANISSHSSRGTATSANCRMMERACRTVFAPILIIRSRRPVSDQSAMAAGNANLIGRAKDS